MDSSNIAAFLAKFCGEPEPLPPPTPYTISDLRKWLFDYIAAATAATPPTQESVDMRYTIPIPSEVVPYIDMIWTILTTDMKRTQQIPKLFSDYTINSYETIESMKSPNFCFTKIKVEMCMNELYTSTIICGRHETPEHIVVVLHVKC